MWDVWILLICDWSVHQISSLDHRNLYAHVWIWNKIYNFLLSGVSPNDIVHCCVWWKTIMSEIWLVSILIWKETEVLGVRVVREIGTWRRNIHYLGKTAQPGYHSCHSKTPKMNPPIMPKLHNLPKLSLTHTNTNTNTLFVHFYEKFCIPCHLWLCKDSSTDLQ